MYKIFHGFHLVEAYQDLKKARRLAKNQTVARCIKLTVAITISLILWLLPIDIWYRRVNRYRTKTDFYLYFCHTYVGFRSCPCMDYFRTDCRITITYRFRQQFMVPHSRYSSRRIGTDS